MTIIVTMPSLPPSHLFSHRTHKVSQGLEDSYWVTLLLTSHTLDQIRPVLVGAACLHPGLDHPLPSWLAKVCSNEVVGVWTPGAVEMCQPSHATCPGARLLDASHHELKEASF